MKIISICDDDDLCTGLQLTGIEGSVVHTLEAFSQVFEDTLANQQISILVITKKLANLHRRQIDEVRLNKALPLIVEL
ncbi:MAG: V-type ATP synthase subunit F [Defluviitaleaceae bacterium]|nr:V-type ATP synthase subunit F [Defluviitaleaceae bacterium]